MSGTIGVIGSNVPNHVVTGTRVGQDHEHILKKMGNENVVMEKPKKKEVVISKTVMDQVGNFLKIYPCTNDIEF